MVGAAGDLESAKLSYLSTALATDSGTRELLDDMRANAAKHHYTTDTVVKVSLFCDLSKAFDNVVLHYVPINYEIVVLSDFNVLLKITIFHGLHSEKLQISYLVGVPQGSILCPSIFFLTR